MTLITTDSYWPGAIVLAHSLRAHGWSHETVAMITRAVTPPVREVLARWWDRVVEVEPVANPTGADEQWFNYFGDLFTKLRIWELVEYDRIVYLDSDTLVTGPLDEMLERPRFAAAPCTA
ncbi:MAG TPA: glycosyltransferase, partial [Gemmatimonadota bacterium]|nr:glycosyltransferase [Gemmatimonadota bacterium]